MATIYRQVKVAQKLRNKLAGIVDRRRTRTAQRFNQAQSIPLTGAGEVGRAGRRAKDKHPEGHTRRQAGTARRAAAAIE